MSEPQYNFAMEIVLFTQLVNAELFSAVLPKKFWYGNLIYQPESGMPLDVKYGVILGVVEDQGHPARFIFIGLFEIHQYLPENVRGKWVKAVGSSNFVWYEKILRFSMKKSQAFPVDPPVLAKIMQRLLVKYFGQFDADSSVVKSVVCVKTQAPQAAAVIQQGILICQGNGLKQGMQNAVGGRFVAVAVKGVFAVGLDLLCVYV